VWFSTLVGASGDCQEPRGAGWYNCVRMRSYNSWNGTRRKFISVVSFGGASETERRKGVAVDPCSAVETRLPPRPSPSETEDTEVVSAAIFVDDLLRVRWDLTR